MQTAVMQCASAGQQSVLIRAQKSSNTPRLSCHGPKIFAPKLSSSAFISTTSSLAAKRTPKHQKHCRQRVMAFEREWPDPQFIAEVEEAFPDQGIANVEEARALISSLGWKYLDVRSSLECEDVGRIKDSINVPMVNAVKKWDPEQQKKVVKKEDNPDFLKQVEKKFPDKETKLLIGCSNGRAYSMDALMALDEAGYTNIAGLKGGYNAYFGVFDNKGNRRRSGEYAESYTHDGDSAGIHGSGAGFPKMDPADKWVPQEY
ncbi:hypothetical protein WJX79_004408 [Trebouxia sp. C0005]|nr:MAG: hypothetical protein FRX49_10441 [Trebouxia sp. A1-2]